MNSLPQPMTQDPREQPVQPWSPVTRESIARAKAEADRERAEAERVMGGPIESPIEKLRADRRQIEAIETIARFVEEYGSARVSIWLAAAAARIEGKRR